jgi:hypothetical protein
MDADEMPYEQWSTLQRSMALVFESAEMAWLRAKAEGFVDPVIHYRPTNCREDDKFGPAEGYKRAATGPEALEYVCVERSDAAEVFELHPELAEMVERPRPGYRMTVIYQDQVNLTVHHCIAPE